MTLPSPAWQHAPVMLRKTLLAQGWNDRALARMISSGEWIRPRRGAYVAASTWKALDAAGRHAITTRAVLQQSKTELVISHSSAMPLYDGPTWGLDLRWVHGTRVDGKCGRREAGVQQHCGLLLEEDVVERYGVPTMTAARVGLEVTTVASAEAALVAVNHLLHAGHTSLDAMRARYDAGMSYWKGTLSTNVVLRLADPRIESVGESRFFYLCYAAGLPAPIPQYEMRDETGRVRARADFAWPELGVFVEFDGKVKYTKFLRAGETAADAVVREKRREERLVELTGWRCIRVVWSDLEQPDRLVRRLRGVLAGVPVA